MRSIFSIRSLLVAAAMLFLSVASFAQVAIGVSVSFGPPELPVYEQPICPGEGYIWTPGYWAWDGYDYYWVPGTWVLAPEVGFFWTPAWWGWGGRGYIFHPGYWGPRVGFYGGINYGYGYFGHGYDGGRWDRGHFYYNRSVNNVNITEIHNVYNTTIVNNYGNSRVSYNGGRGGVEARASAQEQAAMHDRHIPPVTAQMQHVDAARGNPEFRASSNHGRPPVAATSRPGAFTDRGSMAAKEGRGYNSRPPNASNYPGSAVHPRELPPNSRLSNPNSGDQKQDRRYQQQQERLYSRQDQERQQLQQRQEQEHQQYKQQQANQKRMQQVERQHQQQTQQLAQHHYDQQVEMQQHQHQEPQHQQSQHQQSHDSAPRGKP